MSIALIGTSANKKEGMYHWLKQTFAGKEDCLTTLRIVWVGGLEQTGADITLSLPAGNLTLDEGQTRPYAKMAAFKLFFCLYSKKLLYPRSG